jgi:hypothetical protein
MRPIATTGDHFATVGDTLIDNAPLALADHFFGEHPTLECARELGVAPIAQKVGRLIHVHPGRGKPRRTPDAEVI